MKKIFIAVFSLSLLTNALAIAKELELSVNSDNQIVLDPHFQKGVNLALQYFSLPLPTYDRSQIPPKYVQEFTDRVLDARSKRILNGDEIAAYLDGQANGLLSSLQKDRNFLEALIGYYTKSQVREHAQVSRKLAYAIHQFKSQRLNTKSVDTQLKVDALQRAYENSKNWAEVKSNVALAGSMFLILAFTQNEVQPSKELLVFSSLMLLGSVISNWAIEEDLDLPAADLQ